MTLRFDRRGGTDVRGLRAFGQAEEAVAIEAAGTPPATASALLPYYLIAVAAGVTVWFITQRVLGKKR
jgi:hypothetical protein